MGIDRHSANARNRGMRHGLYLLLVGFVLLLGNAPAAAQMVPGTSTETQPPAVEIPENLTREQVRDLVARLSDDQVRELIITQLDKLADQQARENEPTAYVGYLREGIHIAWGVLVRMVTARSEIHDLPASIWRQVTDSGRISGWLLLFQLIGLLVVGWVVERQAKRLLEKATSKPVEVLSLGKRFDLACYGAVMGMIELAAFAAGALLFVEIAGQQTPAAQSLWYQVIWCLFLIRLVVLAVRQVASPGHSDVRLVSVTDAVARQTLGWAVLLAASAVLPKPMLQLTRDFGASAEADLALRIIFGAVFLVLLVVLVIRLRHYGARLIAGKDEESGSIRQGLARIWWMLAIVYLLLIWFMSIGKRVVTGESVLIAGMSSLFLFAMIPFFDMGLKWLITRYFADKEEEHAEAVPMAESPDVSAIEAQAAEVPAESPTEVETAEPEPPATDATEPVYIAVALRYARVLMVIAILAVFVRLWDIDMRAISALLLGQHFAGALFDIGITILLAWALWGVIRISIERKLVAEKGPEGESDEAEAGGLGGTRVETVLPLIRIFIKITLIVMAVLISLSALGVNIGPLIAGAGVVGIAIGFGAQTLVRDIVSGFFYLIDDAFRIGEYVVIDQIRGTVEKISVRSFQLRHHEGPVHTIPYGEIRTLTNWSRDWAIMKFELRIPFETDIDMVRKTIKQIGIDMMEDPVFGPLMLQPVKSQGVNRMDDSALIIRCKFTAIPGQQYLIRREAFTRIQRVFEEKGIQFAPRRVLVEATTPQEAVKAAAAAVLDQETPEGGSDQPKPDQM